MQRERGFRLGINRHDDHEPLRSTIVIRTIESIPQSRVDSEAAIFQIGKEAVSKFSL
jgi:hypothetical protein